MNAPVAGPTGEKRPAGQYGVTMGGVMQPTNPKEIVVVVARVLSNHAEQVALAEHDHVVEGRVGFRPFLCEKS